MPIVIVPFVIVFACGIAQFWFFRRIRQTLVERHPDVWLALSRKAWFVDNAAITLAFGRKARLLDDPVLMARVRDAKALMGVALAACLTGVGLVVTGLGDWSI
jgi:hypothetical protein